MDDRGFSTDSLRSRHAEALGGAVRSVGDEFESHAERLLQAQGLTTVERNYSCRGGELDLVMQEGDTLVFVEVRYRRSQLFGSAAESIDTRKQRRLLLAAQHFLARHARFARSPCRFDVVAISGRPPNLAVDWISGAFSA